MPSKSEKQYANHLSTVVSLNLSDNPFKSIQETTDQVQALMPNITDLQISLFDEMDVDYIISTMPQLIYLNNLKIEREEILAEQLVLNASNMDGLLKNSHINDTDGEDSVLNMPKDKIPPKSADRAQEKSLTRVHEKKVSEPLLNKAERELELF
jgi:hypothetical protein